MGNLAVMVGVWHVLEGVESNHFVSVNHKVVSDEISIDSFSKFGSPWANGCVIQCGRRCVEVGGGGG